VDLWTDAIRPDAKNAVKRSTLTGSVSFPVSGRGMGCVLGADETSEEEDTAMKGMLVIESLPQAFGVLGEMGVSGQEWEGEISGSWLRGA